MYQAKASGTLRGCGAGKGGRLYETGGPRGWLGQGGGAERIASRPCPRGQRLQEGQGCGHRNRHEGKTPTLLASVGLGLSLRQAGRGNGQVLHRLLARRGVAGSLHLWRQGLLVGSSSIALCERLQADVRRPAWGAS